MRRLSCILLAAVLTASTAAQAPLSLRVVESEMVRNPEASYIDGQEGRLKWNYTTGLELKAMLDVYAVCGDERILAYADAWYDAVIDSAGHIYNYKKSNFSTDHICPGRTLFQLYDLTGKEKYRAAMDSLYSQVLDQPRTPEGGFWHKKIYPEQMWLDGLYMAQPFYAEYAVRYVEDPVRRKACFRDIARQFSVAFEHTYDPATGLLRHAWDSSHKMFWCDPATGQSAHAWGRAMGWYAMALVDVIGILPEGEERACLAGLLNRVYEALPRYADRQTGMWFQVLDRPYAEGNYLEATASAMFVYAWLKGCRLGVLEDPKGARGAFASLLKTLLKGRRLGVLKDPKGARGAYASLLKTFVTEEDGIVSLNDCCEVAGLGGKEMRWGDYDYYIHEPVRPNDPKGIGPLVWAALEYERI